VDRRHLELPEIKSLAARLLISIALGVAPLDRGGTKKGSEKASESRRKIVNTLVAAADRLDEDGGRLDKALKALSSVAETESVRGEGAAFDDLRERMLKLSRRLARINCKRCVGSIERICCGDPAKDEVNLFGGECLAVLNDLLACIVSQAQLIYADAASRFPLIKLSTENTHRDQDQDLFREFNISGFCDVIDDEALTTYVVLAFKAGTFDWSAMCGVPYVLAHEVVCHAFQNLAGRRRAADGKCLWSEAWMDRFAFELTRHWLLHPPRGFPKWLLADALEVEEQASAIHKFRYVPRGTLKEPEANELKGARDAFHLLRQNWSMKASLPRHRVARFSARLNASDAVNDDREEVVILLGSLLGQRAEPIRAEVALQHCSDFMASGSVLELLENLKRIRDMPKDAIMRLRQKEGS
jgi:hypothetical protein